MEDAQGWQTFEISVKGGELEYDVYFNNETKKFCVVAKSDYIGQIGDYINYFNHILAMMQGRGYEWDAKSFKQSRAIALEQSMERLKHSPNPELDICV